MAELQESFNTLQEIYQQCPGLPCDMCGNCCVSPHMGFVEFAWLLEGMLQHIDPEGMRHICHAPPRKSARMEGHIECSILYEGKCAVHDYRPLACRLEGIPELAAACGCGRDYCPGCDKVPMGQVRGDALEALINSVSDLNMPFHEFLGEPYYLDAMNFHCWVAICLNKDITQQLFVDLREKIRSRYDLDFLEEGYVDQTGMKGKLDLIDKFFELNNQQRAPEALDCMHKIRDGFPNTGVYYRDQAGIYIQFMTDLIKVLESRQQE